jgi:hypothetical protein
MALYIAGLRPLKIEKNTKPLVRRIGRKVIFKTKTH